MHAFDHHDNALSRLHFNIDRATRKPYRVPPPLMLNFFRNLKKRLRLDRWVRRPMSAARNEPETSPCSSGNLLYKLSLSSPQAPPSIGPSMTENEASTSNVSLKVNPSLEPTCDTAHPAPSHNTNRSELVGVLNGSTQGEVGKQSQPQDILKRKMEHPLNTANTRETEDSTLPNPAENPDTFLGGPSIVPQLHTLEMLPKQSEEACADQDLSNSSNSDLSASQITDTQYSLIPSYCPPVPQLNASAVSGGAPAELSQTQDQTLTPDGANRSIPALVNQNEAPSSRTSFTQTWTPVSWDTLNSEAYRANALHHSRVYRNCKRTAQRRAPFSKNVPSWKASSKDAGKSRSSKKLSAEDERDQCRICLDVYISLDNPLLSPCLCSGTMKFVHLNCLKTWIQIKLKSGRNRHYVKRCELCKGELNVNQELFTCEANHQSQRRDEMMSRELRQRRGHRHYPSRVYSFRPQEQAYRYPPVPWGFRRTDARLINQVAPNTAAPNPSNDDAVHPNTEQVQAYRYPPVPWGFGRTGARIINQVAPNTAAPNPSNDDAVHPNTEQEQAYRYPPVPWGFRRTGARLVNQEAPNTAAPIPSNDDAVHPHMEHVQAYRYPPVEWRFRRTDARLVYQEASNTAAPNPSNDDAVHPHMEV